MKYRKSTNNIGHSGAISLALMIWLAVGILSFGPPVLAQSSIEKEESTQQVKELAGEKERARVAVEKSEMKKPAPPEAGVQWGIYSTRSSFELGYRSVGTGGNGDRFLSDVNVRDGFRLLDYSLDMRAKPGTGVLFDFLKIDVNNAGGDVAQNITMRMNKDRLYKFDANVRRFNYFRAANPEFALGYRVHDLRNQVSDYRLKLLPQRAVQFTLGYGRSMAKGRYTPTYSYQSDMFQLLGDARWQTDDYTAGMDVKFKGWTFGFENFYRRFKNDPTIVSKPGLDTGFGQPAPRPGAITFLDRDVPLRSHANVLRGNIRGSVKDKLHVVMRAWRDDERMNAPYYETSTGISSSSATILSNVINSQGYVERPGKFFDGGVSYDVNDHVTITNTFNYTSWKIVGDVNFLQTVLSQNAAGTKTTVVTNQVADRLTKLTSYRNILDLNVNYGRKFFGYIGWRAQKRDIFLDSNWKQTTSSSTTVSTAIGSEEESITTNSANGGVRMRPTNKLGLFIDFERGQNNNAFVRISPLESTRARFRAQAQANDKLSFNGTFTYLYRKNPTPQVLNDSDQKSYTISASIDPSSKVSIDTGYDYHDLLSTVNLSYYVAGSVLKTGKSFYYSRMSSFYFNSRVNVTNRLDLMLYYYYIVDHGAPAVSLGVNDLLNTYPLRRHNPEARLSYRFNNHVSGNLSYRHYSYNEVTFSALDYRANILTSSLRFTF